MNIKQLGRIMMETITLTTTDNSNNQTLHVAAAAGGLDEHQHSAEDEDQMMNLSDMADLSQEMQEGLVAIPKEVILISLVSQEQALYNPKHENYRNTQRKDMKWMEIAEHVGWTEMQCKSKWKAMRDQYCRELKRSKFNAKANVKWKYFKELDFLRPYALARNYRPRNPIHATNNNNNNNNNNTNSTNSNSNNSFNCTSSLPTSSETNTHHHSDNNSAKFATIKIESNTAANFATCNFSNVKTDPTTALTEDHLSTVLQQQTDENNWTYITGSSTSSNNNSRLDNHTLGDTTHLLTTHHHQHNQQHSDEALYNALVDCVGQIQQQQHQQQHQICHQQSSTNQHQHQQGQQQQQQVSNANNNDEEDDDPIHTFLNIESYFEKELIGLIQNEDVLYNSFHPNYRNVKLKLEVWDEIARKLKKTVKQCRLKWKALRDQFIREHKRLKHRDNVESLPRWKHYDALSFLQKFIKHKASDYDNKSLMQIPKIEIDGDMDDDDDHMNISGSSPIRSPLDNIKCEISQTQLHISDLDSVTNNQSLHQQQQGDNGDNLCVNSGSVGGYDDMDIDGYIIGDSGSVADEQNDHDDPDQETGDDKNSQHNFSVYNSNHNANTTGLEASNQHTFRSSESPQTGSDQNQHQSQQQSHHINMPSLDLSDNSHLMNSDSLKSSSTGHQPFHTTTTTLTNGSSINLAPPLDVCSNVASSLPPSNAPPSTAEASTNTPLAVNNYSNSTTVSGEDDEVGAFFKAVAMKIRNAKLAPVVFTDLQIDILKVINGSLRNN